jgi:hypothetical protein
MVHDCIHRKFYRPRLEALGLSSLGLEARASVDNSLWSRWLSGDRSMPTKRLNAIDAVLALAHPDEDAPRYWKDLKGGPDAKPAFVLGELHKSGTWYPWFDESRNLGAFDWKDRDLAVQTARFLRATEMKDAFVAPCRDSWLELKRSENRKVLWLGQGVRVGDAAANVLDFFNSALRQGDANAGAAREVTP